MAKETPSGTYALLVYNVTGETIPPRAAMKIVGRIGGDDPNHGGAWIVIKPDEDNIDNVVFNGLVPIGPGSHGTAVNFFPCPALCDTSNEAGEDAVVGQMWGTKAGQWSLFKGNLGFECKEDGQNGIASFQKANVTQIINDYFITQASPGEVLPIIAYTAADFVLPAALSTVDVEITSQTDTSIWMVIAQTVLMNDGSDIVYGVITAIADANNFTMKVTRIDTGTPGDTIIQGAEVIISGDPVTSLGSPLTTKGDIWGFDTVDNRIPVGIDGKVLTADSTVALGVSWQAVTGTGTVTSVNASGGATGLTFSGGPITASGTLTLSGTLIVAHGGTGLATLTAHAVLLGEGTAALGFAIIGTAGRVLIDQGAGFDPVFVKISGLITLDAAGLTALAAALTVPDGGTGSATLTNHGVLIGHGVAPVTATVAMTNGQLLIGQTGADPLPTTLTGDVLLTAGGVTTLTPNSVITTTITNNAVTYAKLQLETAHTLLGNPTAGALEPSEITLGAGLAFSGTTIVNTVVGTVTSVNISGASTGLVFTGGPITTSGTITLSGTLAVPYGGTGSVTLTAHGICLGHGVSPITATTAMTNGQLLIGQTGADPLPTAMSADATLAATGALTLATVNPDVGMFTPAKVTVNAKGLVTAIENPATVTLTDASTIVWNLDVAPIARVTLTGNHTLSNPSNMGDGYTYILFVICAGHTLAFDTVYKWPGGIVPVVSGTAILTFVSDGTNMYGVDQEAFA